MTAVLGCDLSSHYIDLVALDETTDHAGWHRCHLTGPTAWERTLTVRDQMPPSSFYDDIYMVAIERPFYVRDDTIRLIQGAVIACLPARLRQPHTLWEAHPSTWKSALGLKTKPSDDDLARIAPDGSLSIPDDTRDDERQNGRDAYCIAMWARQVNARANETETPT